MFNLEVHDDLYTIITLDDGDDTRRTMAEVVMDSTVVLYVEGPDASDATVTRALRAVAAWCHPRFWQPDATLRLYYPFDSPCEYNRDAAVGVMNAEGL